MTSTKLNIPEEILRIAQVRRQTGETWKAIGESLGYSPSTLRWRIDPAYNNRERHRKRNWSRVNLDRRLTPGLTHRNDPKPLTEDELRVRLALIPDDTRDNTGRLLGDPIPGDPRRRRAPEKTRKPTAVPFAFIRKTAR